MGTRLEKLLEEEGGLLSHRELKILRTKEKQNGRESSTERSNVVQKSQHRREKRVRPSKQQQAIHEYEGEQQWS